MLGLNKALLSRFLHSKLTKSSLCLAHQEMASFPSKLYTYLEAYQPSTKSFSFPKATKFSALRFSVLFSFRRKAFLPMYTVNVKDIYHRLKLLSSSGNEIKIFFFILFCTLALRSITMGSKIFFFNVGSITCIRIIQKDNLDIQTNHKHILMWEKKKSHYVHVCRRTIHDWIS